MQIEEMTTANVTALVEAIEAHREQERTMFWSQIDPGLHSLVVEILDNRAAARSAMAEADASLAAFDCEDPE